MYSLQYPNVALSEVVGFNNVLQNITNSENILKINDYVYNNEKYKVVKYDKQKTCPGIQLFFSQILKNKEDLPLIQEIFGYLLWKEYFIERAVMLTGSGRNGKGKTLELMKRFVGVENISMPYIYFTAENEPPFRFSGEQEMIENILIKYKLVNQNIIFALV